MGATEMTHEELVQHHIEALNKWQEEKWVLYLSTYTYRDERIRLFTNQRGVYKVETLCASDCEKQWVSKFQYFNLAEDAMKYVARHCNLSKLPL
jgi:hypothetical protein